MVHGTCPSSTITLKAGIERALHERSAWCNRRTSIQYKDIKLTEHMDINKDRNTELFIISYYLPSNWTDGKLFYTIYLINYFIIATYPHIHMPSIL